MIVCSNGLAVGVTATNGHQNNNNGSAATAGTNSSVNGMPAGNPPMITAPSTPTHVNLHVVTGATPTAATPQASHVPPPPQLAAPVLPPAAASSSSSSSSSNGNTGAGTTTNLRAAAAANATTAAGGSIPGVTSARSRVPPPPAPIMDPQSSTIIIFTINDVYLVDHLPKIRAQILRRLASRRYHKAFITLPGDFLGPSPLSAFDNGSHMVLSSHSPHSALPILHSTDNDSDAMFVD
jgi:hypothetical protein